MYLENSRVKEYTRLLQNAKVHKVVLNRWIRTTCKSAENNIQQVNFFVSFFGPAFLFVLAKVRICITIRILIITIIVTMSN